MALDGIFLHHTVKEIKDFAVGARIEKIYQPNKDELVLSLRSREGAKKLLLSARASSARVCFTDYSLENPKTPPMLCMLLRKRLGNAKITDVYQIGYERIMYIEAEAINELGDLEKLVIISEIMGKYSNIILTDSNGIIIDSLKRVDMTMSSQRLVLPGVKYELPPKQDKLSLDDAKTVDIIEKIISNPAEKTLNKAILESIIGVSPIVCREIEYFVSAGKELTNKNLSENDIAKLKYHLDKLRATAEEVSGTAVSVSRSDGTPFDFSFMNIMQYGSAAKIKRYNSFCELLDKFYYEKDHLERIKSRSQDLLKVITNSISRLSRKINAQKAELEQSEDREHLRICGDLLQANIYNIQRGATEVTVDNFYDENNAPVTIKLDPALSPTQNAQKYYKDYQKAKTAQTVLKGQIEKALSEIEYLETIFDSLTRAEGESDISEIRQELCESGYIKRQNSRQKPPKALPPHEFMTSDGYTVLVGRNNRQNDKLTLKTASKNDLWFHTKNIPGSHTVIVTNGDDVPESSILEAACLAAYHSKARMSSQVPVDYTLIKNVSKPQGAKYGMVIYVKNKTVYVTPKMIGRQKDE